MTTPFHRFAPFGWPPCRGRCSVSDRHAAAMRSRREAVAALSWPDRQVELASSLMGQGVQGRELPPARQYALLQAGARMVEPSSSMAQHTRSVLKTWHGWKMVKSSYTITCR